VRTVKDSLAVVEVLDDALGPHRNAVLAFVLTVLIAVADNRLCA
jgi:hypothetical protein